MHSIRQILPLVLLLAGCASGPSNRHSYTENTGTEGDGNFVIGPDYRLDPDAHLLVKHMALTDFKTIATLHPNIYNAYI